MRWPADLMRISLIAAGISSAGLWYGLAGCSLGASDILSTRDLAPFLASLRDSVIIPTAGRFSERSAALESDAKMFCQDPNPVRLESTKARWRLAALAWANLHPLRILERQIHDFAFQIR